MLVERELCVVSQGVTLASVSASINRAIRNNMNQNPLYPPKVTRYVMRSIHTVSFNSWPLNFSIASTVYFRDQDLLISPPASSTARTYSCIGLPAPVKHYPERIPYSGLFCYATRDGCMSNIAFSRFAKSMVVAHSKTQYASEVGLVDATKLGQIFH